MIKLILVCFALKNLITLIVSLKCSEKYKEATSFVPQISVGSYRLKTYVYNKGYLFKKIKCIFFFGVHFSINRLLKL